MHVRDWMTPNPKTIGEHDRLDAARRLMDEGGFRHLPVVDAAGRLVGVLTDRDVREHYGHLHDTRVTAAAKERPETVGPDDPIEAVAEVLLRRKVGGLPVVDGAGRLAGMITETDLLRGLLGWRPGEEGTSSHVDVELDAATETLGEALALLEGARLPVLALRRTAGPAAVRTFRLQLDGRDADHAAGILRQHGFVARAVGRSAPRSA
jgi:acetoin utilization protein AcuB